MKYFSLFTFQVVANLAWGQFASRDNLVSGYAESVHDNYSIEWNIGELITETFLSDNYSVSSGFIGSDIIYIITATDPLVQEISNLNSFPNPFSETVTIQSSLISLHDVTFTFHDVVGRKVDFQILNRDKSTVSFMVDDIPSGLYFLFINSADKTLGKIKLIRE